MIETRHVSVRLGEFHLDDVSVEIGTGEYFGILGPTGSGKTVLIECIAGIVRPDCGDVWIDGQRVTDSPPEHRRVGYLPQDYALFPHMTVRENLGFGLAIRKRRDEAPAVIEKLAEILSIANLLDRSPGTLSGGEQQRVALGRALATEPTVMLLDEPLSALDVATRETIGAELRRIHDQTGIATIHICHNFDETVRLADRVALVRDGRVVQIAAPRDLLRRPKTRFAAEFVRAENIYDGRVETTAAGPVFRIGSAALKLAEPVPEQHPYAMIRPDDMTVLGGGEPPPPGADVLSGTIQAVEDRGNGIAVRFDGEIPAIALTPRPHWRRIGLRVGDPVRVAVHPESVHTFGDDDVGQ